MLKAKPLVWAAIVVGSILCGQNLLRGGNIEQQAMRVFMRQKLDYSRNLLEGITLERFDLVVTNATLLRNMSQTNAFLVLQNPDYERLTSKYQQNIDKLKRAAQNRNLTNTTEAYAAVTRSCVKCHQYFRHEQHIRPNKL